MADFGADWSCVSDLDPRGNLSTGFVAVAQAIARRLQTPTGGLLDDGNYGYDLTGELNDDLGPADIGRIAARVNAECLKDQRVSSAVATVTFISGVLLVSILVGTAAGPFTLVLSVSDVAENPVQILKAA